MQWLTISILLAFFASLGYGFTSTTAPTTVKNHGTPKSPLRKTTANPSDAKDFQDKIVKLIQGSKDLLKAAKQSGGKFSPKVNNLVKDVYHGAENVRDMWKDVFKGDKGDKGDQGNSKGLFKGKTTTPKIGKSTSTLKVKSTTPKFEKSTTKGVDPGDMAEGYVQQERVDFL